MSAFQGCLQHFQNLKLGGPQESSFLCAASGARDCSSCPQAMLDKIRDPANPFRRGPVAHPAG